VLAERTPDFVRLVADVVQHPRLPESELPRIKAARVRQVAIARSQPQALAQEKFYQTLYGDHPYGRLYPSEAMLNGYTIDQIRAFHANNFGAARAHLYVAGVYDAAAVEKAIREAFSSWTKGPAPVVNVAKPKSGRRLELIDRPGAVQSTVIVGLPVPDASSPDYTALEVTDAILGGAFGSRITTNIREQKGYTYSPFSTITDHVHDAFWAEYADVTTNVTGPSLKEIFGEIEKLRKEPPPPDELRGIQNNMAGTFTLQNASRGGVINQLQFVDLRDLPDTYLTEYVKRVMSVTPGDVQRMMRTYLRPENMAIVVVGDKKVIQDQVAPFNTYVP
jgi:predicted Zn-dependent peptidase